jgi:nucleoside-diphosphate-sugar epimerase
MESMRKIAVTGATGFIGTRLVETLVRKGHIVYPIDRSFKQVECDMIYHLACPSSTEYMNSNPREVMDTIMDATRKALDICPMAFFINASSMGAKFIEVDKSPQTAYNVAKRCMEVYLQYSAGVASYINYRIPSVYGPGASPDSFIQRCIDGTAYMPTDPNKLHYIAHIDDVVEAMADCKQIHIEEITLGQIYELFNSGRRGLHRPATDQSTV